VTVIMILTIAGNYPGNIKTSTPIFDTKEMAEGNAKNIVDGCIGWVENKENMKPIEKFI